MEALMTTLAVLSSLTLMISGAVVVYVYFRTQRLDEVLAKASDSVATSKEAAEKIVDAHNSLSKRVIEMGNQIEMVRNKVEFQGQMQRR